MFKKLFAFNHKVQIPDELPLLGNELHLFYFDDEWLTLTLYKSPCKTYFAPGHVLGDPLYNYEIVRDLVVKYGIVTVFNIDEKRHIIPMRGTNEDKLSNLLIQQYEAFDDYCLKYGCKQELSKRIRNRFDNEQVKSRRYDSAPSE